MFRRLLPTALAVFAFTALVQAQSRAVLMKAVPAQGDPGTPVEYDSSTAENADPSLAQTLKLYGLRGVTSQTWSGAEGKTRITLYEMSDSAAAYGFFAHQRSALAGKPTANLIGADSFRAGDSLYVWQSNYAVRIDAPQNAAESLARTISQNIFGHSRKPPVSEHLPPGGLVAGTEKYLPTGDGIDPRAGVDVQQLGFDSSAEAAVATYRVNGTDAQLLLVLYPTQHVAKKYGDALKVVGRDPQAFTKRAGPLLAIVYGSTDKVVAQTILDGISHEFKVTWNEPKPDLAIGTMIVTIFTFIGIALAFTFILGIGFGGFRVFVKARYPNRVFDRPGQMELIQLKLIQGVADKQIGSGEGSGRG